MKQAICFLIVATAYGRELPPKESPGVRAQAVTQQNLRQTICKGGYTKKVRPPTFYTDGLKQHLMALHKLAGQPSDYELDHRIAIEDGGDPWTPENLWMQPLAEAKLKDRLETALHKDVCAGKLSLAAAQAILMGDFWSEYERRFGK